MRRRPTWLLLLPLLAGGCGETAWRDLWPSLPPVLPGPGPTAAAEADAAAPPAGPVLQLALGRRQARAVLVQEAGRRRLWRSPAGLVLATDGARVVATAGLLPALVATRFEGPDPLAEPHALAESGAPARRLLDLMEREGDPAGLRFGLAVTCRMVSRPLAEQPGILLLEEDCRAAGERGFTNRFWAEAATGTVRHSEQWIGPGLPLLALTMPEE